MLISRINNIKINRSKILQDVAYFTDRFQDKDQICLTHKKSTKSDCDASLFEGTGRLYNPDTKEFKGDEFDFTTFNECYKNTELYNLYQQIETPGRLRIMVMKPQFVYSIHYDYTFRYHYVISTNNNCWFIFPDNKKMYHLPEDNNLYLVDTTKKHTFINAHTTETRIHLVIDDLKKVNG